VTFLGALPASRHPLALAVALVVAHGCASVSTNPSTDPIAIVGVTVIDPTSSQPSASDQTILVSDGVIRAVGPSASVAIPAGARRVDAHGKFAIPGLWDAHVHFMNTGPSALPLFVAMGITSVREMGGYIDSTRAWQARMKAGTLVGPRIVTPDVRLTPLSSCALISLRSGPRQIPQRFTRFCARREGLGSE